MRTWGVLNPYNSGVAFEMIGVRVAMKADPIRVYDTFSPEDTMPRGPRSIPFGELPQSLYDNVILLNAKQKSQKHEPFSHWLVTPMPRSVKTFLVVSLRPKTTSGSSRGVLSTAGTSFHGPNGPCRPAELSKSLARVNVLVGSILISSSVVVTTGNPASAELAGAAAGLRGGGNDGGVLEGNINTDDAEDENNGGKPKENGRKEDSNRRRNEEGCGGFQNQ